MGRKNLTENENSNGQKPSRKVEIIETYYEMLGEIGYENISMAKMAKRMGIPSSLLFYYYPSKQDMTYELVDHVLLLCRSDVVFAIEDNTKFEEYISRLFANQQGQVNFNAYLECYSLAMQDTCIRHKFASSYDIVRKDISDKLEYFLQKQEIECTNPSEDADYLVTLIDGFQVYFDFIEDESRKSAAYRNIISQVLEHFGGEKVHNNTKRVGTLIPLNQ